MDALDLMFAAWVADIDAVSFPDMEHLPAHAATVLEGQSR